MPYLLAIGSPSLYIMKDSGKGSHLELCTDSVDLGPVVRKTG